MEDGENLDCISQTLLLALNKSIKLSNFKEIPSALRDVIRTIQIDLKQRSVYYVLDNQTYGEPVDLLRVDPSFYPHKDTFGAVVLINFRPDHHQMYNLIPRWTSIIW